MSLYYVLCICIIQSQSETFYTYSLAAWQSNPRESLPPNGEGRDFSIIHNWEVIDLGFVQSNWIHDLSIMSPSKSILILGEWLFWHINCYGFRAFQTKPNKTYLTYLPHPPDWPTNLPVPDYTYLIYLSEIALTPDPIYGNPTAYINSQSLKMHKLIQNPKYTYKIHCVKIHPNQFSRSIEISKENTFAHFDFLTPLGPICSCWIGPL